MSSSEISSGQNNPTLPASSRLNGALAVFSLSMLLPSLSTSIANVALPALSKAFEAPFQSVQWIVLAYLLAVTTLTVTAGRVGDIMGRRRLFLIGITLFTAASLLCGFAPVLWMLLVARAAQGLGAAVMLTLGMALVSETVPIERIGRAMGLLGTMSAVGTALGPSIGGLLIAAFGWQAIFLINVPIGVLTWILARRFLPAEKARTADTPVRFDHIGSVLLGIMLLGYSLAMTIGRGDFGLINAALLLAALCTAFRFIDFERTARSPLIQLELLRDRVLRCSLASNIVVATVVMATLVVGPFYLSRALGLDAAAVGLVMSIGPIAAAIMGFPAGRVVDRFGTGRITIIGLIGVAFGPALLASLPMTFGIPGFVLPVVFTTFGYSLFQAANNTAALKDTPLNRRGVVSGMLNLSRNLGLITGASLMGAIFALGVGSDPATAGPEFISRGMRITFGAAALLTGVVLAASIWEQGRTARRGLSEEARP